jgi:hypothetical protein
MMQMSPEIPSLNEKALNYTRIIYLSVGPIISYIAPVGIYVREGLSALPSITITDFSCITSATFELSPVTIIIGAQGSGKSVTTKLFYFFNDILALHLKSVEKDESEDDFKRFIAKNFTLWFPPSAWGRKRFNITFNAGDFTARVLRKQSGGRLSDEVTVSFSDWFSETYKQSRKRLKESRTAVENATSGGSEFSQSLEADFRFRDQITKKISSDLGSEYIANQTFIPAGRAFFTSLGRLVAGFEGSGNLDPVTLRFARIFANLRDRSGMGMFGRRGHMPDEFMARRKIFLDKVFGGEIKFQNDAEFVETKDGRKIPFTSLSSGQQELLPMWSLVDYLGQMDHFRSNSSNINKLISKELIYIEEPEAHLFPSAQSMLLDFLISSTSTNSRNRQLIMTTHSPYIMGKLNVFLKAGQLSKRKKINTKINEVVPRDCWLTSNDLSAYSISNGELKNLIDDDGLIDGTYLDQISEDISLEYSQLLELEATL